MVQALFMGLFLLPDHIGGHFQIEEKDFMIKFANLEFKWRIGKIGKTGSIMNLVDQGAVNQKPNLSLLTFAAPKVYGDEQQATSINTKISQMCSFPNPQILVSEVCRNRGASLQSKKSRIVKDLPTDSITGQPDSHKFDRVQGLAEVETVVWTHARSSTPSSSCTTRKTSSTASCTKSAPSSAT